MYSMDGNDTTISEIYAMKIKLEQRKINFLQYLHTHTFKLICIIIIFLVGSFMSTACEKEKNIY